MCHGPVRQGEQPPDVEHGALVQRAVLLSKVLTRLDRVEDGARHLSSVRKARRVQQARWDANFVEEAGPSGTRVDDLVGVKKCWCPTHRTCHQERAPAMTLTWALALPSAWAWARGMEVRRVCSHRTREEKAPAPRRASRQVPTKATRQSCPQPPWSRCLCRDIPTAGRTRGRGVSGRRSSRGCTGQGHAQQHKHKHKHTHNAHFPTGQGSPAYMLQSTAWPW